MAQKGAKHIVLASRSSTVSDKVQSLIQDLAVEGTTVLVQQCDVSKQEDVSRVVSECSPPFRGVIHSAMVLNVSSILFRSQDVVVC
jgi:NAD(P)-dependent dehydrogenase (short-subunit alcohol dehydrogenase family)